MKQISLLILCSLFITGILAQTSQIELTFTAEKNGQYVPLDSIVIENITQGGDTTLYAPDTVLVIDYMTSIGNNQPLDENTFSVSQNYPNPVKDQTTIGIYIPEEDNVSISITNIQGRRLLTSEMNLIRGNHTFRFVPGKGNMVFFTATWKGFTRHIKIIQSGFGFDKECKLAYSGYDGPGIGLKSQTAVTGFVFDFGDSLSYIGYAATPAGINCSDVKGDIPQSSEAYIFEIIEGIPCPGIPMITYEGKHYKTVQIDSQCWLKENLNVGSMISASQNQTDNGVTEKHCYDDLPVNCEIYGGLYQWDEMMQYTFAPGTKGICPDGWHVPTKEEWQILVSFLGGEMVAGGKMKTTGTLQDSTGLWSEPNDGATNISGFTALPAGCSGTTSGNGFFAQGFDAYLNSSTIKDPSTHWIQDLMHWTPGVLVIWDYDYIGESVRCLKD
ncbi:FISUMP domain-containing protein [Bacteroidota bacterium]